MQGFGGMFSRFMGLARVSMRNGQVRNCYVSADIAVDLLPLFPGRVLMNWGGWEIEKKKLEILILTVLWAVLM